MKSIFHWIISTIGILVAAYLVPGVTVTIPGAFIAAIVLGALNLLIRPIVFILTLPVTIITLGLFSLVINALLVLLTSHLVPGFGIDNFLTALVFGLVLSVINWVFHFWNR